MQHDRIRRARSLLFEVNLCGAPSAADVQSVMSPNLRPERRDRCAAGVLAIDTMRPHMDLDVTTALSGRAGLAGVQWLLLGAPAREALRGALNDMLNHDAILGAMTLQRAKYKPGRHLTAYYTVEARQPTSGPQGERHIEVIWKPTGAEDPHGDPALWQGMQAEALELGVSALFQRLAARPRFSATGSRIRAGLRAHHAYTRRPCAERRARERLPDRDNSLSPRPAPCAALRSGRCRRNQHGRRCVCQDLQQRQRRTNIRCRHSSCRLAYREERRYYNSAATAIRAGGWDAVISVCERHATVKSAPRSRRGLGIFLGPR